MASASPTRVGFIGLGARARDQLTGVIGRRDTIVAAVCEPAAEAYVAASETIRDRGLACPPNEPDWTRFIATFVGLLDAVYITTPHALHFEQARACMEAGIDVLLEKPMVMTSDEAVALIETRDRTGRLLVVAFQGSLSAPIREAARLLRSGRLGATLNVSANVWQNWAEVSRDGWRQDPRSSGGGFLFDTGAHMLNTVVDLLGEDIVEVAAWLEADGHPVEVRAVVMARTESRVLVTMNACGTAIRSCHSDVRLFTSRAILRTDIWGEALEIQHAGDDHPRRVESPEPVSIWERFLDIRAGRAPNPSPPEVGLRMARLWEAIRASAADRGAVIAVPGAIVSDEPGSLATAVI